MSRPEWTDKGYNAMLELISEAKVTNIDTVTDFEDSPITETETKEVTNIFQMSRRDGTSRTAIEVLSMPDVTLPQVIRVIQNEGKRTGNTHYQHFTVDDTIFETVEATCKYSQYLTRQHDEMVKYRKNALLSLPSDIQYIRDLFPSFSSEELEILTRYRPETLHAASQLQGVTPHAVIYLHNYLMKRRRNKAALLSRSYPPRAEQETQTQTTTV